MNLIGRVHGLERQTVLDRLTSALVSHKLSGMIINYLVRLGLVCRR